MSYQYHTAVVGSGSGGLTVAVGLSKLGKKVALIERHQVGGDCTNVGCIPSKSLIHLSRQVCQGRLTAAEALKQTRRRTDHLREEETEWVEGLSGVDFLRGQAGFESPHVLTIAPPNGEPYTISAANVVLATGARPRAIDVPGLNPGRTLTNENLFELADAPGHLVILGGGVIGVEMAFCFARLGSKVTVVDRGERLLKSSEPQASALLAANLEEMGVNLHFQASATAFEEDSQSLTLSNGTVIPEVDRVLLAVGRQPNLHLNLSAVGLEADASGLKTDDRGATAVPHIYAIGDINHRSAFTHSANHQGRRLVKKLAFPWLPHRSKEPHYPSCTFSDPEVAQVGPTLQELQESYHPTLVKSIEIPLSSTDRAYTMGLQEGFVLLHALALEGRLLGATVVAPQAGEMLNVLSLALNEGVSLYRLSELVFPYPVLSEAIKKASDQFVFSTLGSLPKEVGTYLRRRFF